MSKLKFARIFILFILACPAHADDMAYLVNSTPSQRAESQSRFMQTKLGLSEQKLAEIQAINLQFAEKAEPILKGSSMSLIKMNDMKNLQEQKDQALKQVLSEPQFKLYVDSKDELKDAVKTDLSH